MKEGGNLEYTEDYCRNRKAYEEQKKRNLENQNARLNAEISRLENAERRLKTLEKENAEGLKSRVNKAKDGFEWRGQYKNKYDEIIDSESSNSARHCVSEINNMRDQINLAIHNRRSQIYSNNGLIGECQKMIDYWWTSLKNLFN